MGGRPRKPKRLKVFEGNRSREDLDAYDEPEATGRPAKPNDLDEVASAQWDLVLEMACICGGGSCDAGLLRTYCEAWSMYNRYRDEAAADTKDDKAWRRMRDALDRFIKTGQELGLSPKARTAFRMEKKEGTDSKFGELLGS